MPTLHVGTIHPWWQAVFDSADNFGGSVEVQRQYLAAAMSPDWYVAHVAGCVAGFAARTGLAELGQAAE
jgi:hypothetical protein